MKRAGKLPEAVRPDDGDRASIESMLRDTPRIEDALRRAVHGALVRHKALGNPIAVEREGKVLQIPPEEIPV
jgi:hypothetical protein